MRKNVYVEVGNCPRGSWCEPLTGTVREAIEIPGQNPAIVRFFDAQYPERELYARAIVDDPSAVSAVQIAQDGIDNAVKNFD